MSKLVVMYKEPKDPAHFDKHYNEKHAPLAKKMPGLRDCFYGPAKGLDGSNSAYYWLFVATFDNHQAIIAALGSPEGQAAVADIPNYHTHPEPPTILYLDDPKG